MSEKEACPSCGSNEVTVEAGHHKFQYGIEGPDQVTLSAYFTAYECGNKEECGLEWSDQEGGEARDRTVARYLTRKTTERFDGVAKKYRLISIGEAEEFYWNDQTVKMCKILKTMNELQQDLDQCKELLRAKLVENCELGKKLEAFEHMKQRVKAFCILYGDKVGDVSPDQVLKDLETHMTNNTLQLLNEFTPILWDVGEDVEPLRGTLERAD